MFFVSWQKKVERRKDIDRLNRLGGELIDLERQIRSVCRQAKIEMDYKTHADFSEDEVTARKNNSCYL